VRYQSVTDVLSDLRDASRNQWPPIAEGFDFAEPAPAPAAPPPLAPPVRISLPALLSVQAPEPGPEPVTIPTITTSAPKFAPGAVLPAEPRAHRKRTIAIAGGAVAVVAIAIAGVVIWKSRPEAPKPPVVAPQPPPPVEEKPPDYDAIRREAQA